MDGWKINLPFKLVPFQGCNAFPQACHRHLWVTPGMVSWHLGKVSFCIPCILQAASWSAEFTKKHERNHHDLELEELDLLFFSKIWCFFCHYSSSIPWFDSTISVPFEPPYSAAPFFQRVSCRNSDAGCTYQKIAQRCSSPPGWLCGPSGNSQRSFRKFQWKNWHELPGGARWKKVRNLLLASPVFVFQVEVGRGIWLAVLTWDCLSLLRGSSFRLRNFEFLRCFQAELRRKSWLSEAPPPRQANRSCPLRFLPFRHRQNVTGSDEFAGWEM